MSRKTIIIINAIIFLTLVAGLFAWYQTALGSHSRNTTPETITIESGTKTADILKELEEKKIIKSPLAVKIYLYGHPDLKLQAGVYEFKPNTPTRQVIASIAQGETSSQEVKILFREGLTIKEMQAELTKQGYLTDKSFEVLATTSIKNLPSTLKDYSFLKDVPQTATLEGYLFPDTYRLYKDFTAHDLIQKMLANFETKLTPELRTGVSNSGHSLQEVITMASLVEKEVQTEKDMKIVAGLFWDRITVGQALQSCASLAYILGVRKIQYSYEDTQVKSSYNTYLHPGLPPGPISNPGLRAIQATIYPTKTDYNYFLSRPDTGETIFSRTLEEHNEAKAKFL